MQLYVQCLTREQGSKSIDLMRFLATIPSKKPLMGRAAVSAQGQVSRFAFRDLSDLISKLAKKRFNQAEMAIDCDKSGEGTGRDHPPALKAIFSPAPTSALWLSTRDWRPTAERSSRDKYMTAKTREDVMSFHGISAAPSVLEIVSELHTKESKDSVLDSCCEGVIEASGEILNELQPFGCGDIVEAVFIPELKVSVLMPERFQILSNVAPARYSDLGERFDALHPLMFGSRALCDTLARSIGRGVKLTVAKQALDFATLRLKSDLVLSSAEVNEWLITEKTGSAQP